MIIPMPVQARIMGNLTLPRRFGRERLVKQSLPAFSPESSRLPEYAASKCGSLMKRNLRSLQQQIFAMWRLSLGPKKRYNQYRVYH